MLLNQGMGGVFEKEKQEDEQDAEARSSKRPGCAESLKWRYPAYVNVDLCNKCV